MKLRELILRHFGLPQEKLGDIIINRCGGWLDDTINPAIWPGNNGIDLDVFNPDIPSQRTKIYVEFAVRQANGTIPAWARLEFDNAQIQALEQQP
jgi:hypothetical protein